MELGLVLIMFCALGFGVAALMIRMFQIVGHRSSPRHLLGALIKVLSWFAINGATVLGMLKVVDLERALVLPGANGYAILGYVFGFGVTVGILALHSQIWEQKGIGMRRILYDVSNNRNAEILLLMSRYSLSFQEVASRLSMDIKEVKSRYFQAICELAELGPNIWPWATEQSEAKSSGTPEETTSHKTITSRS